MVTEIRKWVASDGREFTSIAAAEMHERAVRFMTDVQPESASHQVYDAVVKAQVKGWQLIPPPMAAAR